VPSYHKQPAEISSDAFLGRSTDVKTTEQNRAGGGTRDWGRFPLARRVKPPGGRLRERLSGLPRLKALARLGAGWPAGRNLASGGGPPPCSLEWRCDIMDTAPPDMPCCGTTGALNAGAYNRLPITAYQNCGGSVGTGSRTQSFGHVMHHRL
jgi:hypothetical protein